MTLGWQSSLILLCILAAAISLLVLVQYWKLMSLVRWQQPDLSQPPVNRAISVIVPARNEEQDLGAALASVLRQQHVQLQVIVVNDHSTDRTREIVDSLAQTDSRVTVIHDPELRPGWLGKVNAMQHGLARADSGLVLFTDADVLHAPHCFASMLTVMQQEQLDLVSVFPRITCVSLLENVNVPLYLGGFCQLCLEAVRPDSGRAFGAGALILMRAAVLQKIGGLAAIRTEMLDDVALATLVKREGYRVGFWAGHELVDVRLFKGNWHALWGPTKNVLSEMPGRVWMVPIVVLLPFLVFWTPPLTAVLGFVRRDGLLAAIGVITYVIQYALLLPSGELLRFRKGKLLFFPLVSIVLLCCVIRASYHYLVRGAVLWRGRSIRVR